VSSSIFAPANSGPRTLIFESGACSLDMEAFGTSNSTGPSVTIGVHSAAEQTFPLPGPERSDRASRDRTPLRNAELEVLLPSLWFLTRGRLPPNPAGGSPWIHQDHLVHERRPKTDRPAPAGRFQPGCLRRGFCGLQVALPREKENGSSAMAATRTTPDTHRRRTSMALHHVIHERCY